MTVFGSTTCCWVPGTLDSIRVTTGHQEEIHHIHDVARMYGREALNALYLKGRYETHHPCQKPLPGGDSLTVTQKV